MHILINVDAGQVFNYAGQLAILEKRLEWDESRDGDKGIYKFGN